MLFWFLTFLLICGVAGFAGVSGAAGVPTLAAWGVFLVSAVLAELSLVLSQGPTPLRSLR